MNTPAQPRVKRRDTGITLVETVVFLALVCLMMAGVFTGLVNGSSMNYAAAQRTAAFGLCKQEIERMRGMEYLDVNTTTFTNKPVFLTHLGGSQRLPLPGVLSYSITPAISPARKIVVTTVTWDFRKHTFQESVHGVIFLQ